MLTVDEINAFTPVEVSDRWSEIVEFLRFVSNTDPGNEVMVSLQPMLRKIVDSVTDANEWEKRITHAILSSEELEEFRLLVKGLKSHEVLAFWIVVMSGDKITPVILSNIKACHPFFSPRVMEAMGFVR